MSDQGIARRLDVLEREVDRLRSIHEILNLMGRETVNWVPKNLHRSSDFYALDEPDVSVEVGDRGVYVGPEAVRQLFEHDFANPELEGALLVHYLASPMIEIAGDGRTARGVWRSPGLEAVRRPGEGQPVPLWSFGAYAVDFIRKHGAWKIWHMHWYRQIKCSFRDGWVDDLSMTHSGALSGSPDLRPTTYHNPYTPTSIQTSIPSCPLPYETWDDPEWSWHERLPTDKGTGR